MRIAVGSFWWHQIKVLGAGYPRGGHLELARFDVHRWHENSTSTTSRLVGARRDKDIEHSNGARLRIGPRDQEYCDIVLSSERIATTKSSVGVERIA
jgi:hypothetical protein